MSENNFLRKTLDDTVLSRRSFLKWSGALGGTAALAGGLNYGFKAVQSMAQADEGEGEWITAACWHNCGGRCLIKARVKNGTVTRIKTDDTHPDSPDYPQQRGCARGRAQRQLVFGEDRLKYPMKRANWESGGGKKELRGKDEWIRISWDEALDIYANEIKRIKDTYGNEAFFGLRKGSMARTMGLYGGFVDRWGLVSWGTWRESYVHFTGVSGSGATSGNDRMRLRDAKLIIMWGANPAVSSNGNPTYNYQQAKEAGARFVFVDPRYTDSAIALADKWIPIRPATDTAMILAMAYHIIENDLQDQDFLDKYTVGFDAEHMPEGAEGEENFKDYVLGKYDGQPKTPEWATKISGVPSDTIRQLARELATTKPAVIQSAGAPGRINNGECFPHSLLTLAWMTGNVGIPGSGVGPNMHSRASNAGPSLVRAGGSGVSGISNPLIEGSTRQGNINVINNCEIWDAVLTGKYTAGEHGIQDIDLKMIFMSDFGDDLNQRAGLTKGIEAFRGVEFVAVQTIFLNTSASHADLVFPITTQWERFGGFLTGNREILIYHRQVTEPQFEAKDDIYVATEVGRRLGLDTNEINPIPLNQQVYNRLAGSSVITVDGSGYEPLLTITASDIAELGAEGEPQEGRIAYQDFKEAGIYQVPRSRDDNFGHTELEAFVEDPEANPTGTVSGKLEIYCQAISDWVGKCNFNRKDPLPKYDPSIEGYEDTYSDWESNVKGDYPLQLYTIHYQRRSHSSFNNLPWLREAFAQDLMMNPIDAKERGLTNGDVVKVTSKHGSVLRPVLLTQRMMPGVLTLGQGAWVKIDEESGLDLAGATNILNGGIATGQGHTGHNSCIVQVEKYEGPIELMPDYEWPQRIVFEEEA